MKRLALLALGFGLAASLAEDAPAPAASKLAGIIEKVTPPATVRLSAQAAAEPLGARFEGFALSGGEVVECAAGGFVALLVNGARVTVVSGPAYTVPAPAGDAARQMVRGLNKLFGSAMGKRAGASAFLAPPADAFVRPATFTIRWPASETGGNVQLVLKSAAGKKLWEATAPAAAGTVPPADARQALVKSQHPREPQDCLLRLTASDGTVSEISFWVLPAEDERALVAELTAWERALPADSWLRSAGQAGALAERQLLDDAIIAAEQALALSPRTPALRRATAELHRRAGHAARAEALEAEKAP